MKKISTSCFSKFDHSFKAQHAESEVKPRRQTLDFYISLLVPIMWNLL